jgi:DNA-binding NarL/FixJ family response regulator
MNNDALHILLAEKEGISGFAFKEAMKAVKLKNVLNCVNNDDQLTEYLNNDLEKPPDILFLDLNLPFRGGIECLNEIRTNNRLKNMTIGVFSEKGSDETIEEALVKGANIFINKPDDNFDLKDVLAQVFNIFWQYHTSGLKKEIFLLNINPD